MSRALVRGLASPHPLGERLPAVYQGDDFSLRFTSALDAVLAPVLSTLDNLDSYLDPRLAPEDFLTWLGAWVGVAIDPAWPVERRRAVISAASRLHRQRGTAAGLAGYLELVTGGEVEIEETGATAWSTASGATIPGRPGSALVVRVRVEDPSELDAGWLDSIVRSSKPANVVHRIEVLGPPPPEPAPPPPKPAEQD